MWLKQCSAWRRMASLPTWLEWVQSVGARLSAGRPPPPHTSMCPSWASDPSAGPGVYPPFLLTPSTHTFLQAMQML